MLSSFLEEKGFAIDVFESEAELLEWITPEAKVVIIAETTAPAMESRDMIGALRDAGCRQPFVAMTGRGSVALAVEAMKAGAAEYLEKPFDPETILQKLDHCFLALTASATKAALHAAVQARLHSLSRREAQALQGLVKGMSNRATALVLGISPRTVEVYRSNIMSKMAVSSLPELVRLAILAEEGVAQARAA